MDLLDRKMSSCYGEFTMNIDTLVFWTMTAAWLTAVIHGLVTGHGVLLLVDVMAFPIGILHGILIWLGVA
jgi:hypothetical protein